MLPQGPSPNTTTLGFRALTYELWGHINIHTIATHDPGSYLDNTETLHAPSYSYTVSTLLLLPGTPTLSYFPSSVSGESFSSHHWRPSSAISSLLHFSLTRFRTIITSSFLPIAYLKFESRLSQIPWWSSQQIGHWVSYLVLDMAGGELVIIPVSP